MYRLASSQPRAGTSAPIRLLIVEDDRDLAEIVGRIAGAVSEAIDVDLAETAADARRRLRDSRYDFVLMDNYLDQGAQGIDLIDFVRTAQPKAGLAMMSSMDLATLIRRTSHERAMQILPKPFSAQLLRAFLHDVLAPLCGRISEDPNCA